MRLGIAALIVVACFGFVGCSSGATSGPAVKSEGVTTRPGAGTEKTNVEGEAAESPNAGSTTSSAAPI